MENLEFKGTKGDWNYCLTEIEPRKYSFSVIGQFDTKVIADVFKVRDWDGKTNTDNLEASESNAKLIASAPDLLEALQNIVANLDGVEENDLHNNTVQYYFQSSITQAKEAIEKALK